MNVENQLNKTNTYQNPCIKIAGGFYLKEENLNNLNIFLSKKLFVIMSLNIYFLNIMQLFTVSKYFMAF